MVNHNEEETNNELLMNIIKNEQSEDKMSED